MNSKMKCDIAVIGGGASGLSAAVGAAMTYSSASIIIAERLNKTGRKILATGNGRCNLSNKKLENQFYHGSVKNVMQIIGETLSAEDFFAGLGIMCKSDSQGRIYPYSNSAASVLGALRLEICRCGIHEECGFEVKSIKKSKSGYVLASAAGDEIECRRIISAAGGYAAPSFGTDGSALRMFREMGYKTSKIYPSIAPLKVNSSEIKGLKGVRVKGNIAAVAEGKILGEEYGEIQFTENAVSGICVFNLSHFASAHEGNLYIRADLTPDISEEKLMEYLFCVQSVRCDCTAEELLTGLFVKNLAVYLVKRALKKPLVIKISDIKYSEMKKIAELIKSLEFKVAGSAAWQNAQVTSGGIHGSCVDENLESVLDRGIYFAGEILDVDGICGGYNLQWAWSSGLWAGKNCAESLKNGVRRNG